MNVNEPRKNFRLSKMVLKNMRASTPADKPQKSWRKGLKLSSFEGFNRVNGVKKYLCIGGKIGDSFFSCSEMPIYYRVDPKECVFIPNLHASQIEELPDGRLTGSPKLLGLDSRQYIVLRPDSTGRYQLLSLEEVK